MNKLANVSIKIINGLPGIKHHVTSDKQLNIPHQNYNTLTLKKKGDEESLETSCTYPLMRTETKRTCSGDYSVL